MTVAIDARSATATAAVSAVDLAHRYAPGRGLDPVTFEVDAPAAVAVTGPNGSGKSTLLRILAGLLKPGAGAATLAVEGVPVQASRWREHVGFAAPELSFYEELSVAENLTFAAESLGLADPRGATGAALERVGLATRAGDRVSALSSGMKQRLKLAFAVLRPVRVLLLDEPGSHLDDAGRAVVDRLVHEQRRSGIVFIATNDSREVGLAERRIELRGRGLGHTA